MQNDFYAESMPYEHFIRNAHGYFGRDMKNGADQCFMRNLMWAEVGSSNVRHLGSFEKQIAQVKKYMDKALDKYLKLKLTADEKAQFLDLKSQLIYANSSIALNSIVEKGLTLTQRFRRD